MEKLLLFSILVAGLSTVQAKSLSAKLTAVHPRETNSTASVSTVYPVEVKENNISTVDRMTEAAVQTSTTSTNFTDDKSEVTQILNVLPSTTVSPTVPNAHLLKSNLQQTNLSSTIKPLKANFSTTSGKSEHILDPTKTTIALDGNSKRIHDVKVTVLNSAFQPTKNPVQVNELEISPSNLARQYNEENDTTTDKGVGFNFKQMSFQSTEFNSNDGIYRNSSHDSQTLPTIPTILESPETYVLPPHSHKTVKKYLELENINTERPSNTFNTTKSTSSPVKDSAHISLDQITHCPRQCFCSSTEQALYCKPRHFKLGKPYRTNSSSSQMGSRITAQMLESKQKQFTYFSLRKLVIRHLKIPLLNVTTFLRIIEDKSSPVGCKNDSNIDESCNSKSPEFIATIFKFLNNPLKNLVSIVQNHTLPHRTASLYIGENKLQYKKFAHLHELIINNCNVTRIPRGALRFLSQLIKFDLSKNSLNKLRSHSLNGLLQLQKLDLSHNNLKNLSRAFVHLRSLEILKLENNHLTILRPDTFLGLNKVTYMNLAHNSISTVDIAAFQPLNSLTTLILSDNPLLALVRLNFFGSRLQYIDVSNIKIDKVPQVITQSIRNLRLAGNSLMSIQRGDLESYPYLGELDLEQNRLEVLEEDALGRHEYLQRLFMGDNSLKEVPLSLPISLIELYLQLNQISELNDGDFRGLVSLEQLFLFGNNISSISTNALEDLVNLKTLNLRTNQITYLAIPIFVKLTKLSSLDLSENPLFTVGQDSFLGLEKLQVLYLSYITEETSVEDESFNPLINLEVLNLDESPFLCQNLLDSKTIVSALKSMREIYLTSCNLTAVPAEVKKILPHLQYFKVFNNHSLEQRIATTRNSGSKRSLSNPVNNSSSKFIRDGQEKNASLPQNSKNEKFEDFSEDILEGKNDGNDSTPTMPSLSDVLTSMHSIATELSTTFTNKNIPNPKEEVAHSHPPANDDPIRRNYSISSHDTLMSAGRELHSLIMSKAENTEVTELISNNLSANLSLSTIPRASIVPATLAPAKLTSKALKSVLHINREQPSFLKRSTRTAEKNKEQPPVFGTKNKFIGLEDSSEINEQNQVIQPVFDEMDYSINADIIEDMTQSSITEAPQRKFEDSTPSPSSHSTTEEQELTQTTGINSIVLEESTPVTEMEINTTTITVTDASSISSTIPKDISLVTSTFQVETSTRTSTTEGPSQGYLPTLHMVSPPNLSQTIRTATPKYQEKIYLNRDQHLRRDHIYSHTVKTNSSTNFDHKLPMMNKNASDHRNSMLSLLIGRDRNLSYPLANSGHGYLNIQNVANVRKEKNETESHFNRDIFLYRGDSRHEIHNILKHAKDNKSNNRSGSSEKADNHIHFSKIFYIFDHRKALSLGVTFIATVMVFVTFGAMFMFAIIRIKFGMGQIFSNRFYGGTSSVGERLSRSNSLNCESPYREALQARSNSDSSLHTSYGNKIKSSASGTSSAAGRTSGTGSTKLFTGSFLTAKMSRIKKSEEIRAALLENVGLGEYEGDLLPQLTASSAPVVIKNKSNFDDIALTCDGNCQIAETSYDECKECRTCFSEPLNESQLYGEQSSSNKYNQRFDGVESDDPDFGQNFNLSTNNLDSPGIRNNLNCTGDDFSFSNFPTSANEETYDHQHEEYYDNVPIMTESCNDVRYA